MLVLTRKPQQKVMINDNIEVVYISYHGDSIRLGFKAPEDMKIMRAELLEIDKSQEDLFNR
jgi:carbon storage regulator